MKKNIFKYIVTELRIINNETKRCDILSILISHFESCWNLN